MSDIEPVTHDCWQGQQFGTLNYNLPPQLAADNGVSVQVRRYDQLEAEEMRRRLRRAGA